MTTESRPLLKFLYSLRKADRIEARQRISAEFGVSLNVIKNWATDRTTPPVYVQKRLNQLFATKIYEQ